MSPATPIAIAEVSCSPHASGPLAGSARSERHAIAGRDDGTR
jgi:hypothetical protein